MVWEDLRNGNDYDIYAQRVTAAGEIAPGWPANGVPVCTAPISQGRTLWSVVPDGFGGVLIDWWDGRNALEGETSYDIYAQRVLADGSIAPGWPVDGAPVSRRPEYQSWPVVIADGMGGGYFTWESPSAPRDIYVQHLTAAGAPQAGWPMDGLPVCVLPGNQFSPHLAPDGVGGVLVAWFDDRDGAWAAYAQRVHADGSVGWTAGGVRIVLGRGIKGLIADGAGGAYLGCATALPGLDGDYYLQRFTDNGAIAPGWPEGGALVCAAPDERAGLRMAPDGYGGVLLSWYDYRNGDSDIYAQRMQPDGTRAPGWPVNGLAVTDAPGGYDPDPAADGMGGLYLAWTRNTGGIERIALQHISAIGTPTIGWPANGLVLPDEGQPHLPSITEDGVGGAIAAWERNDGTVRALRLAANGPVAVELALVSAEAAGDRVRLLWHSAEASNLALRLERRIETSDWTVLASLSPDGAGRIEYEDRDVVAGTRYGYRLAYSDHGADRTTPETWVTVPRLELALRGFQPNPAVGIPAVAFVLAEPAPATLEVYDVAGRRVASHEVGGLGPGGHTVPLDAGARLAPGVYALRLVQGDRVLKARGVVMR